MLQHTHNETDSYTRDTFLDRQKETQTYTYTVNHYHSSYVILPYVSNELAHE